MRKRFIAGNWKMNGTLKSAEQLLSDVAAGSKNIEAELAVFPPFAHLLLCSNYLSGTSIRFGAQTLSEFPDGAYTGEISATMLTDLGCHYVIVGHSERRQLFHETNEQIYQKCKAAVEAGLIPILCVGETLVEREADRTLSVVHEQLAVVPRLKDNCANFADIVIAYEPVWAIGTGQSATPEQAQAVHAAIRAQLYDCDPILAESTRVLYGGSVKPNNAKALFSMPDIDGALIGGASLNAVDFLTIAA